MQSISFRGLIAPTIAAGLMIIMLELSRAFALAGPTLYVDPAGDDRNDCLTAAAPCATIQRAVDQITPAPGQITGMGTVMLARGTYSAGATITYHKVVTFIGDCDDPSRVVVRPQGGGAGFMAQDHAIAGINCVTIEAADPGTRGVKTRQFAIIDIQKVRFGPMP